MLIIHWHANKKDSPVSMVTDRRGCEAVTPVLTQVMRVKVSWAQTEYLRMDGILVPTSQLHSTYSLQLDICKVDIWDIKVLFNFLENFRCLVKLNANICNSLDSWISTAFCSTPGFSEITHQHNIPWWRWRWERTLFSIVYKTSFKRSIKKMVWKWHFLHPPSV